MDIKISSKNRVGGSGVLRMPGDKSISHRALILGAIADGITEISGFLSGQDCLATARCLRAMGVVIEQEGDTARVYGQGKWGLKAPKDVLDVGNSGTTLRLLAGLLAGQRFDSVLDGDASIRRRPMDRVAAPLRLMGADIAGDFAPVRIRGRELNAIHYKMPINSAQVKSAVMLAGLYADGITTVEEIGAGLTRNHTEKMMAHMDDGRGWLKGRKITVPGDFSSAAYFLAAGALFADENGLLIENVGANPTRTGFLDAMRTLGADIEVRNKRTWGGEDVGDIFVRRAGMLKGMTLDGDLVPRMIDEVPIFAVLALFADGVTEIRNASELAVKESNRITAMANELNKMGALIKPLADGMIITGNRPLHGAVVDSHSDHRVAMALAIAAMGANGDTIIKGAECVDVSFPGFIDVLMSSC